MEWKPFVTHYYGPIRYGLRAPRQKSWRAVNRALLQEMNDFCQQSFEPSTWAGGNSFSFSFSSEADRTLFLLRWT
jgi:hypothetical protein